jgi:hypothetical protein
MKTKLTIENLPDEILAHTFSSLNPGTLKSTSLVCKRWSPFASKQLPTTCLKEHLDQFELMFQDMLVENGDYYPIKLFDLYLSFYFIRGTLDFLLNRGADINVKSNNGKTAIYLLICIPIAMIKLGDDDERSVIISKSLPIISKIEALLKAGAKPLLDSNHAGDKDRDPLMLILEYASSDSTFLVREIASMLSKHIPIKEAHSTELEYCFSDYIRDAKNKVDKVRIEAEAILIQRVLDKAAAKQLEATRKHGIEPIVSSSSKRLKI